MSAPIYFAAGVTKPVELADAQALGLGYAFEETPQSSPISGRTPTGEPGSLIWNQRRLGDMVAGYVPDKQTWRKIPGRSALWVGFYNSPSPTPANLRKLRGMAGESLVLGDGNEWTIPRLALWGGEAGFSPAYSLVANLDDDGNWISGGPASESAPLKSLFDRLYAAMADPEGMAAADALDAACELLAVNYAVSKIELAMLQVLKTDATLLQMLKSALDWDTVLDWIKKKSEEMSQPDFAG